MASDKYQLCCKTEMLLLNNPAMTLRQLTREFGVDRHQIEIAIKEQLSLTFRALKQKVKLVRAIELISDQQNRSLKEVAAAIGITPNALSRFIRLSTGQRASDFRHSFTTIDRSSNLLFVPCTPYSYWHHRLSTSLLTKKI